MKDKQGASRLIYHYKQNTLRKVHSYIQIILTQYNQIYKPYKTSKIESLKSVVPDSR